MAERDSDKRFWSRVNLGLVMLGLLALLVWRQLPDKKLRLVVCDVGQGEAILVSWQSYQLLVDGGPDNSVLSCLGKNMAFWDRRIEVVVLTHPEADHMTGLIEVVRRYEVGQFVAAKMVNDIPEYWQLKKAVVEKGVEVKELIKGDELRLGSVKLKVLWPWKRGSELLAWEKADEKAAVLGSKSYQGDVNEMSVVLEGSFGEFDWLLTGDIGEKEELELVREGLVRDIELLKVGHHGSKYSSSEVWLRQVSPEVAVISVGKKNRFGHPTEVVLDRLEKLGVRVLRTDEMGMIKVVSDGQQWWQE